jgi:carboxymethylenebutenolidase
MCAAGSSRLSRPGSRHGSKRAVVIARVLSVALALALGAGARAQGPDKPDTVVVHSGELTLHALLWRPAGAGPFPAILFNHGSGHGVLSSSGEKYEHTMEWQGEQLGPVFARRGYVFLFLLRRGTGLSEGEGENSADSWNRELTAHGEKARNRAQLRLLETVELQDALAGLAYLRSLREVNARRVAVAGHSYGGSLTLLLAERDSTLRGAVVFSGSARSWPRSPEMRERLLKAAAHARVPTLLLFAENDYSIAPARALCAAMKRAGQRCEAKIYPAVGHTAQEGHSFVHLRIASWEPDVFSFLEPLIK